VLSDGVARGLLVLHLISAFVVIGLTTHCAVWLRRYVKGAHGQRRAASRFAMRAALAYVIAFGFGNAVYPTYKVHVRLGYLDDSAHVARARALTIERRRAVAARLAPSAAEAQGTPGDAVISSTYGAQAAAIARLFDTKEHWVALGLFLSIACVWMLRGWRIDEPGGELIAPYLLWFAYGAAAAAWYGGVVGALASIWRAV